MEQRNEPSTAEIVRELRKMQNAAQVVLDSGFGTREGENNMLYIKRKAMAKNAADRLESQERTIADKDAQIEKLNEKVDALGNDAINYDMNLSEMTARAESAEKWAAAAISDIERLRLKKFTLCPVCEFEDMIGCAHKNHCTGYHNFKWRGLPQEGDKDE